MLVVGAVFLLLATLTGAQPDAETLVCAPDVCEHTVTGTGLANGDMLIAITKQEDCATLEAGSSVAWAIATGTAADGSFSVYSFNTPLTPGLYDLCWCAAGSGCNRLTQPENFSTAAGTLAVAEAVALRGVGDSTSSTEEPSTSEEPDISTSEGPVDEVSSSSEAPTSAETPSIPPQQVGSSTDDVGSTSEEPTTIDGLSTISPEPATSTEEPPAGDDGTDSSAFSGGPLHLLLLALTVLTLTQ